MKKKTMLYLFLLLLPIILYGLYVAAMLSYGTITDFRPEEKIELTSANQNDLQLSDSTTVSFLIWNIGYSGLGYKADFFFDGGKKIRSSKNEVQRYFTGIVNFLEKANQTDFILLQEVDRDSKRSYFTDEFKKIQKVLPKHNSVFAENYKVKYVPVPLSSIDPLGKVTSGLATFSKYRTEQNTRHQFPGEYPWPKRIYFLDRCMLVTRVKTSNGKELVVINSHNSAYDGGQLKPLEMQYLKQFIVEEYQKGNYIVVGADWNQCPPNFDYDHFAKHHPSKSLQTNISEDFLPKDWQWVYDQNTATNRKLQHPFDINKTFTSLIDFYLVSPNVEIKKIHTQDLKFEFSDHQPVFLEISLKP